MSARAAREALPRRRGAAHEDEAEPATVRRAPRRGARRTVVSAIREIPRYLTLLGGLLTDSRVAALDKVLVAGAIAYVLMPFDLIPDVLPFFGQVDDVFLVMLALERLIGNAGTRVLAAHWQGSLEELRMAHLREVLSAAAFFLPRRVRRRLRRVSRR